MRESGLISKKLETGELQQIDQVLLYIVLCPWVLWTKNTRPDLTALFTNGQLDWAGQTDGVRAWYF